MSCICVLLQVWMLDRFGNASADVKAQIKAIRDEIGLKFSDPEFPIDALKRVYSLV